VAPRSPLRLTLAFPRSVEPLFRLGPSKVSISCTSEYQLGCGQVGKGGRFGGRLGGRSLRCIVQFHAPAAGIVGRGATDRQAALQGVSGVR
jgi:hypothetical protein